MIIGIPKETKDHEYRVGMLPVGVEEFKRAGHRVLFEKGAGLGSGIPDTDYESNGAELVDGAARIWGEAELVVKVKEPLGPELGQMRAGQMMFTYFHFAADEHLTRRVIDSGATAIAYETLTDDRGRLRLLTPMSEVAGRMSIQQGAKYLERPQEGRGILLGGVPGVEPAHILILGGGVVGRTPPRSLPVSAPRCSSWTRTSTACASSTTSCRRTSPRSSATATPSAISSRKPTS